jgi:CBS domain-containing protein
MKELSYFKAEGNPDIFIAQAGVHKTDWITASPDESIESIVHKMSANRYDILPIIDNVGRCQTFYRTIEWARFDEENIELANIEPEDRLYYLTDIDDAIKRFAATGRKFYFLDNLTDVVGLVTISDLNCKQIYLYLYSLVSLFERKMVSHIYGNRVSV